MQPSGPESPSPDPPEAAGSAPAPQAGAQEAYDLIVQQLIPGYASLARLSVSLLAASPLASPPSSAILVAGCGTGAELLEARAQRPDWRLTALDPSATMLAAARGRVGEGDTPPPISWLQSRVEDLSVEGSFEGALAVLVMQSLPDDGGKLAFLSSLARTLKPGAQLVLVDLMRPERSPLRDQVEEAWRLFQRASGLEGAAEALQALSPRLHPIGLSRLSALAEAAGFSDPAPVFQALDFQGFLLQRRS